MPTVVWIVIGLVILIACAGSSQKTGKRSGSRGKPVRIDRPHYYDEDDHECSVCGARFRGKGTVCPKCGVRFSGTKEDDGEFIEEMITLDDDD